MKFIHAKMTFIHMTSLIYGHIHPCRWIKITLNFKFQAISTKHKLHTHAQAIFMLFLPSYRCLMVIEHNLTINLRY